MQSRIADFNALGVSVVAISTSDVEGHRNMAEELDASFPILADSDGSIVDRYGLMHPGAYFGDETVPVARPAVFLLDVDLVIRRRFLTDNWRVRKDPETLLEALRESGVPARFPGN